MVPYRGAYSNQNFKSLLLFRIKNYLNLQLYHSVCRKACIKLPCSMSFLCENDGDVCHKIKEIQADEKSLFKYFFFVMLIHSGL